jgi:hypothetical protein
VFGICMKDEGGAWEGKMRRNQGKDVEKKEM